MMRSCAFGEMGPVGSDDLCIKDGCQAWVTTCSKVTCAGFVDKDKCKRIDCEFSKPHCRRLE
jgi:hypothetical protein